MYYLEITKEKEIAGEIIRVYVSDKAMEEIIDGKNVQHYLPWGIIRLCNFYVNGNIILFPERKFIYLMNR